ncbi:hypothetical protein H4CHR_02281 [Variovorax sp. PBS-H4]|uniref:hypothetical protein n=1 Tax=Variovorax sp. PBS-H4 TaxID=434008 RepID=UPI0013194255|nr:hypothetical protein [Variovorax sp. PBS-H4]VTU28821.1 hypothetical protein H4CHR_02281 [Variovorax sp. PBS-H4]
MQDPSKTPQQNTPTPAQKAMKQESKTPAERGDIVGPNDGPATTARNQPVPPGDADAGPSGNQVSSADRARRRTEESDGEND